MTDKSPPAFPVQDAAAWQYPGMSLRDWFAGQALAGLCANEGFTAGASWQSHPVEETVKRARQIADAMLAERDRHD